MISRLSHTFIYVLNQDKALTFYTEILGFDVKANFQLGPGKKWISVSPPDQPDLEIVLMKAMEGPVYTEKTAARINEFVAEGNLGWCVFECKDIYATYEELSGKGVEFINPPTSTPSGISANFRDNSGNWFSLKQTT